MSTQRTSVKLSVKSRNEKGTTPVKQIRREGWLPCVVYGPDRDPLPVQVDYREFETMLRKSGAHNLIIDLAVDGEAPKKALLREIQRDSVKDFLIHADFNEISMTKKLRIDIDVETVGEPVGVTQEAGIIEHLLRTVSVECLPDDIVNNFELDISALHVGDTLFVKDIPHDDKLTILTDPEQPIVAVALPRVEEEPAAKEEGEGEEEGEGDEKKEEKAEGDEKGKDGKKEKED